MPEYEEYVREAWEEEHSIFSVGDLFNKISLYNSTIIENEIKGTLLFRGQANDTFTMEASIFRNDLISKETMLINELILQEPFEFGNQMTDFEQLVKMQHYGLPTQ